jgi:hypothetical protein
MRFAYRRYPSAQFILPVGGNWRDYPMCDVGIESGSKSTAYRALFDTGSDDTVFPAQIAARLGIDLSTAPLSDAKSVAGTTVSYRYVHVTLRLSDGVEHAEWPAIVGFAPIPMQYALLGRTGFHDFFDVNYRGQAREVVLFPNGAFTGIYLGRSTDS